MQQITNLREMIKNIKNTITFNEDRIREKTNMVILMASQKQIEVMTIKKIITKPLIGNVIYNLGKVREITSMKGITKDSIMLQLWIEVVILIQENEHLSYTINYMTERMPKDNNNNPLTKR